MLFHSFEFAVFFPAFFVLYWALFRQRLARNLLLVAGSYWFYAAWDWRFLALIILSSAVDYVVALRISAHDDKRSRRMWLAVSLCVNLGLLLYFKYVNFFIASFNDLTQALGLQVNTRSVDVILPVGISFYTFQTLSYTIDVYRKTTTATRDVAAFFAYVSFFPQLIAGPIERSEHLLPQFQRPVTFSNAQATSGARLFLWGFFKKAAIADSCAVVVDVIFADPNASALARVLGAVLFAFQIYGDFSGYSDMAIGLSRMLGIDLMQNFRFPYFSRDIAEFWRRWHISLSTWFRDYLYIPLGGNGGNKWVRLRNVSAVFLVSGFWHGANWTFIAWGALNAALFVPLMLTGKNRRYLEASTGLWPSPLELGAMFTTFSLTCVCWVFFRALTVHDAVDYIAGVAHGGLALPAQVNARLLILLPFLVVEWLMHRGVFAQMTAWAPRPVRWACYFGLLALSTFFLYSHDHAVRFIYFDF